MSTISAQPQLSLYKRIRRKLRRIKRLTVGYIKNIPEYIHYRKVRHHITGPLRMARAAILLEDHQEQKKTEQVQQEQEQEKWKQSSTFLPLALVQESTPEHPTGKVQPISFPICGGAPVPVQYPGQFAGYQPIIKRPDVTELDTRRTELRPVRHLQHLIEPEVLPDQVGVTAKEAEFLLDQHFARVKEDPDVTVKRETVKRGDRHA